jgi:carboxylesterase type B
MNIARKENRNMTYLYRVEATITADLEVEANSATHAEELVQATLYPASEDSKVNIHSNEGIEITTIESDSEGNPFDDKEFRKGEQE